MEQDLYAEAASWKLLATLHGTRDMAYPAGSGDHCLEGYGASKCSKQKAAALIATDPKLNRCVTKSCARPDSQLNRHLRCPFLEIFGDHSMIPAETFNDCIMARPFMSKEVIRNP